MEWDSIKNVTVGGKDCTRYSVKIGREHVGQEAPGVGGIKAFDIGKIYIKDIYPDGNIVDCFALLNQKL